MTANAPAFNSYYCSSCQQWVGGNHGCNVWIGNQTVAPTASQTIRVWNGPVCHVCGQGYLSTHDCDLEPAPCPDNKPGCAVAHYRHKRRPE